MRATTAIDDDGDHMKPDFNIEDPKYYNHKKAKLNLSFQQLTSEDVVTIVIPYLNKHHEIKTLDLFCNNIGAEGTKALATIQTLTSLDVSDNNIGDEGAKALANMQTLTSLDVSLNNISDKGAKALAYLKNLEFLNVRFNNIGTDGAKYLSALHNLTFLNVKDNNIGAEGAIGISMLHKLTYLNASYNYFGKEGAIALAAKPALTAFDVSCNYIGEDAKKALQDAFPATSAVEIDQYYLKTSSMPDTARFPAWCELRFFKDKNRHQEKLDEKYNRLRIGS